MSQCEGEVARTRTGVQALGAQPSVVPSTRGSGGTLPGTPLRNEGVSRVSPALGVRVWLWVTDRYTDSLPRRSGLLAMKKDLTPYEKTTAHQIEPEGSPGRLAGGGVP